MRAFAELLDRLALTPSRNAKLALLKNYFRQATREDAGWALAVLTGSLRIDSLKASTLRDLVKTRVDPVLYDLSYDYVGDQAETIALIWPKNPQAPSPIEDISLSKVVETLRRSKKAEARAFAEAFLDAQDPTTRWAFIKLATGATLRIGVSARLAKTALAAIHGREVDDLEKVWSAFEPPYKELFDWLEHGGDGPALGHQVFFHPPLLAHPLTDAERAGLRPEDFAAEWKWDGIRIQLASDGAGRRRLFSRSGEDISAAFPEVLERAAFHAVLDGELLIRSRETRPIDLPGAFGDIAPFSVLQQRLNRKKVSPKLMQDFPPLVVVYDVLFLEGADLRGQPWIARRKALEDWMAAQGFDPAQFRLSARIPFQSWDELERLHAATRTHDLEGLMLKRLDSPYIPGRPKGLWFKWKRTTLNVDAVLMYAQRGHGKRSSFYSDYTFGLWRPKPDGGKELVPVGKAYSGFTDEELVQLDKWIRAHTVERFGSVRAVEPGLVLEVEFDAVQRSTRHKSGVALRFPRLQRIRWDKPAAEASTLPELLSLLPAGD
jgi:DNA ligase-1